MKTPLKLCWFVLKIAILLFLAAGTAAALFGSDAVTADLDRELFPGFTASIAVVLWAGILKLMFGRKRRAPKADQLEAGEVA